MPKTVESINAQTEEKDSINAHKFEEGHLCSNESNKTSYSNDLPINAQTKENGHLWTENGHSKASVEVQTVKDAAGIKLFDLSLENEQETNGKTSDAINIERCWVHTCRALLHGADICPSCEQDQNAIPF
jgi:hypothetical protein